jgi:hypothetical protein
MARERCDGRKAFTLDETNKAAVAAIENFIVTCLFGEQQGEQGATASSLQQKMGSLASRAGGGRRQASSSFSMAFSSNEF